MDRLITLRRLSDGTEGTAESLMAIAVGYPTILTKSTGHALINGTVVTLANFAGIHAADLNSKTSIVEYATATTFAVGINTLGRTITIGTATATPTEMTQNEYGEPVESWVDIDTVWAQRLEIKGFEKWVAQQNKADIQIKFKIRYRDDITPANRFVFEDRDFDILTVEETGRREGLILTGMARAE